MLFLEEVASATTPSQPDLDRVLSLLASLQKTLSSLFPEARSNQKEAKAWLLNTIASLDLRDAGLRRRKFGQFLPGGSAFDRQQHEELGRQLLQELFLDEPAEVSRLLAREPSVLRHFFRRDAAHVRMWFGHFSMNGLADFKHGAYALARYALQHRDQVWRLLVWSGKHGQAPVAVAARTHYFCELDVPRTVGNLLEECPEFWESAELWDSMASGQLLALAPEFWAQELYGWLKEYSSRSDHLYSLVCDYLESRADWRRLCGRLLPLLSPPDLLSFASDLLDSAPLPPRCAALAPLSAAAVPALGGSGGSGSSPAAAGAGASGAHAPPGAWLVFRSVGAGWAGLGQVVVGAAVGCSLRQLGRLAREEENSEELQEMAQLAEELGECETPELHWHLRRELVRCARQHAEQQAQQRLQPDRPDQPCQPEVLAAVGVSGEVQPGAALEGRKERGLSAALLQPPPLSRASPAVGTRSKAGGAEQSLGMGIQLFLLLHLWAAYLHLRQLAAALPPVAGAGAGANTAEQEFRRLVAQAGLICRRADTASGQSDGRSGGAAEAAGDGLAEEAGWERQLRQGLKERRRSRKGKKHKKERRRSSSRGGGRKRRRSEGKGDAGRRHKRRRRDRTSSSSDSESSGGSSDGGHGARGRARRGGGSGSVGELVGKDEGGQLLGRGGGTRSLWVVQAAGSGEVTLAALDLAELVVEQAAAWAYAEWLVSQGG